jgi:type I restriction enzyme S subunit
MASDWKSHKVGELADSISVTHPFDKKRLIFLNTSDILRGKVLHNSYKDIGSLPGQAKKTIKKDDILLSEIRPANGRYAFIDFEAENYVVSTKLMVIRAREKILPKFLFYFLTNKSITNWLQHLAESRSGTFPQITFDQIADLNVKLPNRDEQEKIIAYIDPIDEKIELNHQMNTTLEKIGQAIFKRWFIDFEFPNEKGKPYKSSGGEMVDSELGEIPLGWKVGKLREIGTIQPGFAFKSRDFQDKGVRVIKIRNIQHGTVSLQCEDFVDDELFRETDEKFHLGSADILIAMTGAELGKVGIIPKVVEPMVLNQRVGKVVSENKFLLYFYLNKGDIQSYIKGISSASSAQGNISNTDIENIEIVVPHRESIGKFTQITSPLFERFIYNLGENLILCQLRDSLLPRFMSGQIRVPAG